MNDIEKEIALAEKKKAELEIDIRNNKRLHAKERMKKAIPNIDKDSVGLEEVYRASIEFVANYRSMFSPRKFNEKKNKKLKTL